MITDDELREHGCSVKDNIHSGNIIEFDWYRPDQSWRIFRLHRIVGYLRAVADCTGNFEILRKVACILDHKGELTVIWHEQPTDAEKTIFANAWNAECESGELVEHKLEETQLPVKA